MFLLIDNFDSFTHILHHSLEEVGVHCQVERYSQSILDIISARQWEGIVISPGPESPQNYPVLFELMDLYHTKLPILGICLGHQLIGTYFGAKCVENIYPMHGKVSKVVHNEGDFFFQIKNPMEVGRYHSLILEKETLPRSLETICNTTDDKCIMGVKHKKYPVVGFQFHPESVLTNQGKQLLKNWKDCIKNFEINVF